MKQPILPRSFADLRGLRAARWTRESTAGQYDRYGPEVQRDQQGDAIARAGGLDLDAADPRSLDLEHRQAQADRAHLVPGLGGPAERAEDEAPDGPREAAAAAHAQRAVCVAAADRR